MVVRSDILFGIFVGGASTRMGGAPKGLLPSRETGEPLVVRLARVAVELGYEPVLVGKADPYAPVLPGVRSIGDEPAGIGPLGGLSGLLAAAHERPAIAVACDMPRVSRELLRRLGNEAPGTLILAPRSAAGDTWEPLCARYDASAMRPLLAAAVARGVRSFQRLFESVEVVELTLSAEEREELVDWDSPEDVGL